MSSKYRGISGMNSVFHTQTNIFEAAEFEKLKVKLWNIHSLAIVRLYSSPRKRWQFEAKGWLILSERKDGVLIFTMIGIQDHDNILWRHELYEGFEMEKLNSFFLAFHGEKSVYGLSFSESFDATRFWEKTSELVKDSSREKGKKKGRK